MPEPIADFWPDDIGRSSLRTPGVILKEVASQLGTKTQQVVKADVRTSSGSDGQFYQYFVLVVPAMDNYKYQLFYLLHPITLYPLSLFWKDTWIPVASEEQLIEKVKEIIGSPETRKIIQALLSQVGSPNTSQELASRG
jgi:hypothetical protein